MDLLRGDGIEHVKLSLEGESELVGRRRLLLLLLRLKVKELLRRRAGVGQRFFSPSAVVVDDDLPREMRRLHEGVVASVHCSAVAYEELLFKP